MMSDEMCPCGHNRLAHSKWVIVAGAGRDYLQCGVCIDPQTEKGRICMYFTKK